MRTLVRLPATEGVASYLVAPDAGAGGPGEKGSSTAVTSLQARSSSK